MSRLGDQIWWQVFKTLKAAQRKARDHDELIAAWTDAHEVLSPAAHLGFVDMRDLVIVEAMLTHLYTERWHARTLREDICRRRPDIQPLFEMFRVMLEGMAKKTGARRTKNRRKA